MDKIDNEDNKVITFLDIKKNIKNYSLKELRCQANVLIDDFHDISK